MLNKYVVLYIAECPRMFQMLTASRFGTSMQYDPTIQGFVMTRETYRIMYTHLIDAVSLLDLRGNQEQKTTSASGQIQEDETQSTIIPTSIFKPTPTTASPQTCITCYSIGHLIPMPNADPVLVVCGLKPQIIQKISVQ